MFQNKIFYLASFGFGAGVLLRSFLLVNWHAAVYIGLISIFSFLFCSLILKKNWATLISILILASSIGILRLDLADQPMPEIFEKQIGENASLSGIIVGPPDQRESNTQLTIEVKNTKEKTKVLVFVKTDENYRYGDELQFTGKLEKPDNFSTDQGKEFDYVNYLRKDGIFYVMKYPKISILSHGNGNFIKSALYSAKEIFSAKIDSAMPAPESILMEGLILGERSSFSPSLRQAFINTGTIHIVTISGYNITLVSEWIMKMFGFLPVNFAISSGIFTIFLFIIMTGGSQTAIRAGIMATLALLAKSTERLYDVGRALVIAADIMVLINPFILAFDVSFQLSFLATIAIIFLSPKIEKYFYWIRWKWLRDIISMTSAAYIFVLPYILYKMGTLSLISLPANIAILPLVPATMILGFITGFAGLISGILAFIPGKIAYVLLHYELSAIGFFSTFPFASLSIPNFPLILVILIYAIFFWNLFGKYNEIKIAPSSKIPNAFHFRFFILMSPLFLTLIASGFLYYHNYQSSEATKQELTALLNNAPAKQLPAEFTADARTKASNCNLRGPLPDHACTPGAVFKDATLEQICVPGYTKTVRNVSTKLRKQVFAEYGIAYPVPRGSYEVDHLIPLAIGGSNDIANLFPEPAEPKPGFHEKDIVEVYLQQEVCAHRAILPVAQKQVANNWLAIYNNLTPDQILAIKKKYWIQ